MTHLPQQSPDLTTRNIEALAALFPSVITESRDEHGQLRRAINFEQLRQLLSPDVLTGDEAYEFTWVGKKAAMVEANRPIRKTLRPCKEESKAWDTTENLYIEGDNLDVLKLLQESYLGKVKMIYIDPPYNTGNDFIYRDNFSRSRDEEEEQMGMYDEEENRLFRNTDSNGRFHSDWCSMMFARLMVARGLLVENGLIFISIDDCENTNLRRICDEVFGESNFVDTIIWKKRYGGGAKERFFVSLHEYTLVYCRDINVLEELLIPLTADNIERYYQKTDNNYQVRGPYRTHPLEATKSMDTRENLVYPIPAPDGTEIWPKRQWLWSKDRAISALSNGELEIYRGNDGGWQVATKQYLRDNDGTERSGKMFSIIEDIYTQHGTNEMISILGDAKVFSFPKPSAFIRQLLTVGMKCDDIILDFFSGSATTAHAVMKLNAEEGGHRKFIMVQLPEPCDEASEAYKAGYKNICEIGKERIRRAGEKIKAEIEEANMQGKLGEEPKAVPDIGFRVLKLAETNMKDVYYSAGEYTQAMLATLESNIKEDRTDLDLLFGCLLDWGVPLSMPYTSETLEGCAVHTYGNGTPPDLIACFAQHVPETVVRAIAERQPLRVVFRDSSFAGSPQKINVEEIFKVIAPNTSVKVI
jgi:adenine-specific DNA-methyltransferase